MAEKRKSKPQPITDKKQSDQFRKVARELEADGELSLTDAEEKLDRAVRNSKRPVDSDKAN